MQAKESPAIGQESDDRNRGRSRHEESTVNMAARDKNGTRQHVVEAAIRCILEKGFYRASSNAIAERAGLTWGVIQYHFGNRENLMLAVLEEGSRRLAGELISAKITGPTLTERMEEFFDILAEYYASPDYLAFIQVLVNLGHDPSTSDRTRQTLAELNDQANPELKRLLSQVFAGTGTRQRDLRTLVFHALRGLSISHVMLTTVEPYIYANAQREFLAERKLLARALTLLVENPDGKK
ncbi:TetR/AcrR family transcriptional regulator [Nocardia sp.]|uniref:TetR/AcrR family transcriptional regulator n=1 Tax=Nocardia sp. TaxID=1821 RepID=UPI002615DEE0|nr:TetR/AcrR family transcriptional regulator [Nocardia sp.]